MLALRSAHFHLCIDCAKSISPGVLISPPGSDIPTVSSAISYNYKIQMHVQGIKCIENKETESSTHTCCTECCGLGVATVIETFAPGDQFSGSE